MKWKWLPLLFYDVRTSKESNHILSITIQCVCSPTNHPKNEKVFSFFKFWCIFGVIFDHPENLGKNFPSKKNRETCQNSNPRDWRKCYRFLLEKLKIILMWQVWRDIEARESLQLKRFLKAVEKHFWNTKYWFPYLIPKAWKQIL